MASKPMSLNRTDVKNIFRSGLIFLAPVVLIYLGQITGALQTPGHIFNLNDFIPSTFTLGAMTLYCANRLTDIARKFIA